MSNLYTALPVPVGNGSGAAVDVSTFGAQKTIVVTGTANATLNIEFNNDPAQLGSWQSLATIQNSGLAVGAAACRWMRVSVSGFNVNVGGTSSVNVGGTDDGVQFTALPVPGGSGAGAPIDVSAISGTLKTVQVGGPFRGTLIVEVSEDGVTEWAQPFSFGSPGAQSQVLVAKFMRVRRVGVPVINPGLPVVNVGFGFASSAPSGGSVPSTRTIFTTAPLTIDGGASADLSANRTIAINTFTTLASGIVPASGAAGNILRGNATWDTIAQLTAALDVFTTLLQGVVPASGAAGNVLRGDGTWSTIVQLTAALDVFTTLLQGVVPASGAAGNVLRGDGTWSTIVQLTAALDVFTTLLQGVVPASGAAGNVLRGDGTWSTITQLTAALNVFTTTLQGVVPASGGGTANFLRADGSWAAPTVASLPAFDTILTPAAITFGAAFDNWNPGTFGQNTLVRCTTDGSSRAVRGMVGGVNGITVTLMNVNASSAVVEQWQPEDGAATAANRFRTGFNSGGCTYYYDGLLSRWVLITGTP